MSIIYDALKKVEGKVDAPGSNPISLKIEKASLPKRKINPSLIYAFAILLSIFIAKIAFDLIRRQDKPFAKRLTESMELVKNKANLLMQRKPDVQNKEVLTFTPEPHKVVAHPSLENVVAAAPLAPKKQTPPSLVLNGIFFSEEEGYALINNQILREGESIAGAVLKRINAEDVELEFDGSTIRLSTNINAP
jgi:type II secretory pathway component PulC